VNWDVTVENAVLLGNITPVIQSLHFTTHTLFYLELVLGQSSTTDTKAAQTRQRCP